MTSSILEKYIDLKKQFATGEGEKIISTRALGGGFQGSGLRSIYWRFLLGTIKGNNTNQWITQLKEQREAYYALKAEATVDPTETEDDNLLENNPLCEDDNTAWGQHFKDVDLRKCIEQDLIRLDPDSVYFNHPDRQKMMLEILFVWAKQHEETSYRQGMHELLSQFIFVLKEDHEAFKKAEVDHNENKEALSELNIFMDANHLEADSFILFTELMKPMIDFFLVIDSSSSSSRLRDPTHVTPIYKICNRIQNELLPLKDSALHQKLSSMDIQPAIYALPWVRLLFGREFQRDDVLFIWDVFFTDCSEFRKDNPSSYNVSFIEHFGVVMLFYVREFLLESNDFGAILSRIKRFPPIDHVQPFIERTLTSLAKPKQAFDLPESIQLPDLDKIKPEVTKIRRRPQPSTTKKRVPPPASPTATTNKSIMMEAGQKINQLLSTTTTKMQQEATLRAQVHQKDRKLQAFKQKLVYQSKRDTHVVKTIDAIVEAWEADVRSGEHTERQLLSIAELKQVRDILKGEVDYKNTQPFMLGLIEPPKVTKKSSKSKKYTPKPLNAL
mmetsp:Transcript_10585/g.15494  ORF Transcript_10585/g.15494 Transcript_10585/m.15494 type:complete len:556 (+) Transcript_10585:59-1726(+)